MSIGTSLFRNLFSSFSSFVSEFTPAPIIHTPPSYPSIRRLPYRHLLAHERATFTLVWRRTIRKRPWAWTHPNFLCKPKRRDSDSSNNEDTETSISLFLLPYKIVITYVVDHIWDLASHVATYTIIVGNRKSTIIYFKVLRIVLVLLSALH